MTLLFLIVFYFLIIKYIFILLLTIVAESIHAILKCSTHTLNLICNRYVIVICGIRV